MSTEKDREAIENKAIGKIVRETMGYDYFKIEFRDLKRAYEEHVKAGIQYARQGEKERLKRLFRSMLARENFDEAIDEFLEQEKSK